MISSPSWPNKTVFVSNAMKKPNTIRPRGRPITRKVEIQATAKQIAQAIFAAAKQPDPSKRIVKRSKGS